MTISLKTINEIMLNIYRHDFKPWRSILTLKTYDNVCGVCGLEPIHPVHGKQTTPAETPDNQGKDISNG